MKFLRYCSLIMIMLSAGLANATAPYIQTIAVYSHASADAITGGNPVVYQQALSMFRIYGLPVEFIYAGTTTDTDCNNGKYVITSDAYLPNYCPPSPAPPGVYFPPYRWTISSQLALLNSDGPAHMYFPSVYPAGSGSLTGKVQPAYGSYKAQEANIFNYFVASIKGARGITDQSIYTVMQKTFGLSAGYSDVPAISALYRQPIVAARYAPASSSFAASVSSSRYAAAGFSNASCTPTPDNSSAACVDVTYNDKTKKNSIRFFKQTFVSPTSFTGTCTTATQTNCQVIVQDEATPVVNGQAWNTVVWASQTILGTPHITRDTTRNVLWMSYLSEVWNSSNGGVSWVYRGRIGPIAVEESMSGGAFGIPIRYEYFHHPSKLIALNIAYSPVTDEILVLSSRTDYGMRIDYINAGATAPSGCNSLLSCVLPLTPATTATQGAYTNLNYNWHEAEFRDSSCGTELTWDATILRSGFDTEMKCTGLAGRHGETGLCYIAGTDATAGRRTSSFIFDPPSNTGCVAVIKVTAQTSGPALTNMAVGTLPWDENPGFGWDGQLDIAAFVHSYYMDASDYPFYGARTPASGGSGWSWNTLTTTGLTTPVSSGYGSYGGSPTNTLEMFQGATNRWWLLFRETACGLSTTDYTQSRCQ